MGGVIALLYGFASYAVFVAATLYAVVFLGNMTQVPGVAGLVIPKTIDSGTPGPLLESIVIDAVLLLIFAIQHSVMARSAFKRVWTRIVPASVERSTYVLLSSLALLLIFWQWRALPDPVWTLANPAAELTANVLFWVGWAIVLVSTFLINHFELLGLRQVWARLRGVEVPGSEFRTPLLYKLVRHPLYLGFIIAFWETPVMSAGHLLFAIATTGYIFIGAYLEERDLIGHFGEAYVSYRSRVPMILPFSRRKGR